MRNPDLLEISRTLGRIEGKIDSIEKKEEYKTAEYSRFSTGSLRLSNNYSDLRYPLKQQLHPPQKNTILLCLRSTPCGLVYSQKS